ncbi:50S ribosomal protein L4 [Candidatus Woesearchaeota archaeon]|nr:50S ribosomal protein L4 [Candidatus Woesearchaeota archaeon]
MKLKIFNTAGTQTGEAELPVQFSEPVREDLIKKAFLAIQNNKRQAYGTFKEAGQRHAVKISKRRRDYKASYGKGISRVPRKTLSHRGSQFFWAGANAPGTVGGRRAHPPKPNTGMAWKLNIKEKQKAICSALSATMNKEFVARRGHLAPQSYPFIISDDFEKVTKTKQLLSALIKIGFEQELNRASQIGMRAGKGKLRGRRKTTKKSLLFVVSETKPLIKAAANIPGIDVLHVKKLNVDALAPGCHAGRAALFTTKALDELRKGLFTNQKKADNTKKSKITAEKKGERKE